jgi:hypothetical protein
MIAENGNELDSALNFMALEASHFIKTRKNRKFLIESMNRVQALLDSERDQEVIRLRRIVRSNNLIPNLPTE